MVYYNWKNHDEKWFFAIYLNLARQNAYLTLSHIANLLGEVPCDEENLCEMPIIEALNGNDQSLLQKSERLILKHFPFFAPIIETERNIALKNNKPFSEKEGTKLLYNLCKSFFQLLNDWRNFYTHYDYAVMRFRNDEERDNFFKYLDFIFDTSLRMGKERFKWEENELSCFRRLEGKDRITRRPKENPNFLYHFEREKKLTEKGFVFFVSLFLEKKDSIDLINHVKQHFNDIFRDFFAIYSIRIPQHRVESTDSTLALGLDILNELKRFPKPVFELLQKKDKISFISNIKESDQNESNFIRMNNRFAFFALNFIDELKLFPQFRFHIKLGRYFYKFYDKKTIDGETRKRNLSVGLKTFARLNEVNSAKKEQWDNLIWDEAKEKLPTPPKNFAQKYITNAFPRYHLNANQIALKKVGDNIHLPELDDGKTHCDVPDCFLSAYELPALVFYGLILGQKNTVDGFAAAEKIIDSHIKNFRKLFSDIHTGEMLPDSEENVKNTLNSQYQIDISDIPVEMQDYLLDKKVNISEKFKKFAGNKIRNEVERCQRLIEKIKVKRDKLKDKGNKIGKKKFVVIKSGSLAKFLAKDMLNLQPSLDGAGKDKITSLNYQVLQSYLTSYSQHKHLLKNLFLNCALTFSKNKHPFLEKLNPENHLTIVDFFIAYLIKRKEYFEECLKKIVMGKNVSEYFLHPKRKKWNVRDTEYYRNLAKTYSENPISLPRGMFNEGLKKWFSENGNDKMKKFAQGRCNSVFLIQNYFAEVEKDKSQEFYNFKRSYKILNLLLGKRSGNKLLENYFSVAELSSNCKNWSQQIYKLPQKPLDSRNVEISKLYRESALGKFNKFLQNEKIIRFNKVQDMLLFLMVKEIFTYHQKQADLKVKIWGESFKLAEINANTNGILNVQVPCSMKIFGKIIETTLKVRNYGDFVRYTKDSRLENLFKWVSVKNISLADLKTELENYQDVRFDIFSLIHRFEKLVLEKFAEEVKKERELNQKGQYFTNFSTILNVFYRYFPNFAKERAKIESLRNNLSHNEYPEAQYFSENITNLSVAVYLRRIATELFMRYNSELSKIKL